MARLDFFCQVLPGVKNLHVEVLELLRRTKVFGAFFACNHLHTRFLKSATYGEMIEIHTSVEDWQAKVFRQRHVVRRGETMLCEGTETRIFVQRDPDDPERLRSIAIPEDLKALCL